MKKSQLRNIIRESIKELLTEQSPPHGGPGYFGWGVELYDCSQTVTVNNGPLQGHQIPDMNVNPTQVLPSTGCLYVEHNGAPLVPSGYSNYLIDYQGTLYRMLGGTTSATGAFPDCTGGIVGTATLVNGTQAPFYNPNGPTCSNSSFTLGCTDPTATNYDPTATVDDGSCIPVVDGCMDSNATNYDPSATIDDGSCIFGVDGCMDSNAYNYDLNATQDDGSCDYGFRCKDTFPNKYGIGNKCQPGNAQNPGTFANKQACLDSGCEPMKADKEKDDGTPSTQGPSEPSVAAVAKKLPPIIKPDPGEKSRDNKKKDDLKERFKKLANIIKK